MVWCILKRVIYTFTETYRRVLHPAIIKKHAMNSDLINVFFPHLPSVALASMRKPVRTTIGEHH